MVDEPEVIRHQMEMTRASLGEKLETLERQVVETVQDATHAVTDTVETVKESVQSSVASVKESVQSSVDTVKESLDLGRQVQKHPWAMLGCSVGLGFLSGLLLNRAMPARADALPPPQPYPPYPPPRQEPVYAPLGEREPARASEAEGPGIVSTLADKFSPEIDKLKGLAIGTLIGVVRDMIEPSVPEQLRPQVGDVVKQITTKLGGTPIEGPVLDKFMPSKTSSAERFEVQGTRY